MDACYHKAGALAACQNLRTTSMSGLMISGKMYRFRVPENYISAEYIEYFLRDGVTQQAIDDMKTGMSDSGLNLTHDRFFGLPITIPPFQEQLRIVAKIDSLSGKSKRARHQLDYVPRLIEKCKQAILTAAFRGDLTDDWRKSNPASESGPQLRERLLKEKKEWRRPPNFTNENDLEAVPTSWTWMPVETITSKVVDGVHKKPSYVADGIPFLMVKNLTAGPDISFAECKFVTPSDHAEFTKRTNPEKGDILITKDGTLGVVRAIRIDTVFSIFVSLALVKPIDRQMTDYLELAFQSPLVQEQMVGVGSGLQHIHLTDLKRDFIPIAPAEERAEIVKRVRIAFTWIDRLASEATKARKLIDHLDQAVLTKAFQGELVPQDPSNEPASVLLERVRTEREAMPRGRKVRRQQ
jgi:type I restriction enzyme S subunit